MREGDARKRDYGAGAILAQTCPKPFTGEGGDEGASLPVTISE